MQIVVELQIIQFGILFEIFKIEKYSLLIYCIVHNISLSHYKVQFNLKFIKYFKNYLTFTASIKGTFFSY